MAYTFEQIHTVADSIAGRGENPTINKVREELGGGSYTTISEAMRYWRARQREENLLREVQLPQALQERLHKAGAELWQTALNEAEQRLAQRHKELDEDKEQINRQLADAQDVIQSLEREQEQARARIGELGQRLEEREGEIGQLTGKLEQCRKELFEAQTLQKSSDKEIAYLHDELNSAKETIGRYEQRFEGLLQRFEQGR
ncbi:DNA-binding protein [Halorhodospira halochloris]|uniref:DNA-binding protein n=1 Tax=Halorhodospira halochloris TaxID=1052 RepID=UPI001EE80EF8|nr:DNA-binding protein [Halorhodospira halochloris]MCG5549176.1 DNA-binding protein [Halorhodospira halochloris]